MRKGACFICKEVGHRARNCPKKEKKQWDKGKQNGNRPARQRNWNMNDIVNAVEEMTMNEFNEFQDKIKNEQADFPNEA